MSRTSKSRAKPTVRTILVRLARACGRTLAILVRRAWRRVRRRRVPVEILLVDSKRRRALTRILREGLSRIQHALSEPLPAEVAIVVQQQVVDEERSIPAHCHVGERPDGSRFALIRLALQVGDRTLATDELLASLADQIVALVVQSQKANGAGALAPIGIGSRSPAGTTRLGVLPPDPLAPRPSTNSTRPREHTA